MAKIEGLTKVLNQLKGRAVEAKKGNASVLVGYSTGYALYVHEDLEAHHTTGQAKFLVQPYLQLQDTFRWMINEAIRKRQTMAQALLLCGLKLQRESMKRCPVDTGVLRASAFTKLEAGGG